MSVKSSTETATEIYVCNNVDCRSRGAERVLDALRAEFSDDGDDAVQVHTYMCFSACNCGPNVIVPSRRCWLSSVTAADAPVVRKVLEGAEAPARLRENCDEDLEALILGIIDAGLLMPEDVG